VPWLLELFEAAAQQRSTSSDPQHLAEMAAGSTLEAPQAKDRELEKALVRVSSMARQVFSETVQSLWRDNHSGSYTMSADPNEQARAFRAERPMVSAHAGYGIVMTRCELASTRTLLEPLWP
jgi:hypothetical protein